MDQGLPLKKEEKEKRAPKRPPDTSCEESGLPRGAGFVGFANKEVCDTKHGGKADYVYEYRSSIS